MLVNKETKTFKLVLHVGNRFGVSMLKSLINGWGVGTGRIEEINK